MPSLRYEVNSGKKNEASSFFGLYKMANQFPSSQLKKKFTSHALKYCHAIENNNNNNNKNTTATHRNAFTVKVLWCSTNVQFFQTVNILLATGSFVTGDFAVIHIKCSIHSFANKTQLKKQTIKRRILAFKGSKQNLTCNGPTDFSLPQSVSKDFFCRAGCYGMACHSIYGIAWCGMSQYGMASHGVVCHSMVWHRMVWYVTVWYGITWCGISQYDMASHGVICHRMIWHHMV